jgi:hypothetical protein
MQVITAEKETRMVRICTTKFKLLKTISLYYIQFVPHWEPRVLWLARTIGERSICKWLLIVRSVRNTYWGADKSRARPGRGGELMTARVSMLLKSRASLTNFRGCFLPGRAKDLSASRYWEKCGVFSIRVRPTLTNPYSLNAPDRCTPSDAWPTQHDMLPRHQIIIRKSSSECF